MESMIYSLIETPADILAEQTVTGMIYDIEVSILCIISLKIQHIAAIHGTLFLCGYLKVWRLGVKHDQLRLLITTVVDVSHPCLKYDISKAS